MIICLLMVIAHGPAAYTYLASVFGSKFVTDGDFKLAGITEATIRNRWDILSSFKMTIYDRYKM
jgi:hypothetical protein